MSDRQACGCGTLHRIDCLVVAAAEPNAMANELGEVFYADDADEAVWFAREHGASPLNPEAFRAMFGDVEGVGS